MNADDSASTCVGQNSTQNPQPLHRSTVIATAPLAIGTLHLVCRTLPLHAKCQLEISTPETLVHHAVRCEAANSATEPRAADLVATKSSCRTGRPVDPRPDAGGRSESHRCRQCRSCRNRFGGLTKDRRENNFTLADRQMGRNALVRAASTLVSTPGVSTFRYGFPDGPTARRPSRGSCLVSGHGFSRAVGGSQFRALAPAAFLLATYVKQ